ncbi:MAG: tetratricopeptide repeat protein [Gammaproteobacteria bacterium]|nr:tetratricopeptide repeat protein [Gammaproteobacteria bacterium]
MTSISFEGVRALIKDNNLSKSESMIRHFISLEDQSAEAYYLLALTLYKKNKWDDAVNASLKAVEIASSYAEPKLLLAHIYFNQGKLDESISAAKLALEIAPDYSEAHHVLAQYYFAKGQTQDALLHVNTAIHCEPNFPEAYFTQGYIYYSSKLLEQAARSFKSAITVKPDYMEAMNQLALVLQDMNLHSEAESLYLKVIDSIPAYANAHNNFGFLLRKLGRSEQASESFLLANKFFNRKFIFQQPSTRIIAISNITKRYILAIKDFLVWNINGKVNQQAWQNFQYLNQATNNHSGNYFNQIIKTFSSPVKKKHVWQSSKLFYWANQTDISRILNTLNEDGLYICEQTLPIDVVEKMLQYTKTALKDLRVPFATGITAATYDSAAPMAKYHFDEASMLQHQIFQTIVNDPFILAIARAYFKVEPKFASLNLWWNLVYSRNPSSDLTQIFHMDISHLKSLKFFVYLNDTTNNTGAFSFVRGSHKSDIKGKKLRERGIVGISDEDICKVYGEDQIIDVVGTKGTVFIADTRGFHKCHRPLTGDRLLLEIHMVNSLFPCAKKKI